MIILPQISDTAMSSYISSHVLASKKWVMLALSFFILVIPHSVLAQEQGDAARNSIMDPSNNALAARVLASQVVSPLTISHDWFLTAMVPPAFFFGQAGTFSPNEFTFTANEPVMLSVTDDFCKGDRFEVFDNGVSIGATSNPVNEFPGCSVSAGPEAAATNPEYSSADFVLGPGFHHIKIKVIDSPFDAGAGYIEVHEAPIQYEYAAKVACGPQRDPNDMRLARGFYAAAINVHNPHAKTALFSKKLALTYPPAEQRAGEIHHIAHDSLQYDEALAVDCMDILKEVFPNGFPTPYIKGFVVIQSPVSLDVVGVYSTATIDREGRASDHSSIHVEPIGERITHVKPPVYDPPVSLGHFKCYNTQENSPVNAQVSLNDQFGAIDVHVAEAVHFCNPVQKTRFDASGRPTVTPISDEDHHLTFYRIDPDGQTEPHVVSINNQFGREQKFEVTSPIFLAVPTQKLIPGEHQEPENLDHFQCYQAIGDTTEVLFDLRDQFLTEQQVKLGNPVALCNPVEKNHDGIITPRKNPDDHLMCYQIEGLPFDTNVRTFNQFGDAGYPVTRADMLCVPSEKTVLQ